MTILTGYLGSGKTTLVNHILTDKTHGKKIAIIENEFGDVGIDDALMAKNATEQIEEEIIEMMNGCICCTVRQDLVVVLKKFSDRIKNGSLKKLDCVLVETTGMADPAPVAQTFFVDDEVKENFRLDGIVTLIDAKHVEQHLDEPKAEGEENEGAFFFVFFPTAVCPYRKLIFFPKHRSRRASRFRGPHDLEQDRPRYREGSRSR